MKKEKNVSKKKNYAFIFLIITLLLFIINIIIIVVFSAINMQDNFYNSLNVASLSIAFLSFIASSFFSLSVYLQSKEQSKINESLPKKDDQYIIANYSLFNIEREVTFFSINGYEKEYIIESQKYLSKKLDENVNDISRLIFLPTTSINIPTYKVLVKTVGFYSSKKELLYYVTSKEKLDGEYSSNVLQRGYNCFCVDIAENIEDLKKIFIKTQYIELEIDIISVFNVNMSTKFLIYLNGEKNVDDNPDKNQIKDLTTYNIHHSNYVIQNKTINS